MTSQAPDAVASRPLAPAAMICLIVLPLMLAAWIGSFFPYDNLLNRDGKPLIVDFMCFYLAGECIAENKLDVLYDDEWAHHRSKEVIPELEEGLNLPNRYPPLVAVVLAPLSRLPYPIACLTFLGMEITVLVVTFLWWRNDIPALRELDWKLVLSISFGFPMALECLMDGQLSVFSLGILSTGMLLVRRGHVVAAGFAFGVAMLKPVVAMLLTFGLLLRYPKLFYGLAASGIGMLAATYYTTGFGPLQEFLSLGTRLATDKWATEAPPWKIQGIQSYLLPIMPELSMRVTVCMGAVLVLLLAWHWRKGKFSDNDALSLLLIINGLFGMYVPIYDLLLLLPVLYLQAEQSRLNQLPAAKSHPWRLVSPELLPALGMVICLGPHLSQAFMLETGFQPFSIVFLCFTVWMLWTSNRPQVAVATLQPVKAN